MRKLLVASLLLVMGVSAASATKLRPINVQNAYIDTDRDWEVRVQYDYFRDHVSAGGVTVRTAGSNLPRIDVRKSFDTVIPTRIGVNTALSLSSLETEALGVEAETGRFGFNNIGLTLEAALLNDEDFAMTLYLNQHFATQHSGLLALNQLRPVSGADAYGFQFGTNYQFNVLFDSLTWYGDLGYRFDVPESGSTQHSLVYYNEMVWDTGTIANPTIGLLGNSVYTHDLGTDLRLVPGWVNNFGDDNEYQFRVGFPIGLTSDSPDFGVQVGLFAAL